MAYKISYTYDAAGNRATKTEVRDGSTAVTTYTYDAANQLTSEVSPGGTITYTYDGCGNCTLKETPEGDTHTTYDAANQATTIEPPSGAVDFTYNAYYQRVRKDATANVSGGEVTKFIYDHKRLLAETDDFDVTKKSYTSCTQNTGAGGEYGDLISEYDNDELTNAYPDYDAQWNTKELLDDSGDPTASYRNTAFGLQSPEAQPDWCGMSNDQWDNLSEDGWDNLPACDPKGPNGYGGQAGYYHDEELELYLMGGGGRGRYYDPATGRFTSQDPSNLAGGDTNLYRYVHNNPVNAVDPSGNGPQQHYMYAGGGPPPPTRIDIDSLSDEMLFFLPVPYDPERILLRRIEARKEQVISQMLSEFSLMEEENEDIAEFMQHMRRSLPHYDDLGDRGKLTLLLGLMLATLEEEVRGRRYLSLLRRYDAEDYIVEVDLRRGVTRDHARAVHREATQGAKESFDWARENYGETFEQYRKIFSALDLNTANLRLRRNNGTDSQNVPNYVMPETEGLLHYLDDTAPGYTFGVDGALVAGRILMYRMPSGALRSTGDEVFLISMFASPATIARFSAPLSQAARTAGQRAAQFWGGQGAQLRARRLAEESLEATAGALRLMGEGAHYSPLAQQWYKVGRSGALRNPATAAARNEADRQARRLVEEILEDSIGRGVLAGNAAAANAGGRVSEVMALARRNELAQLADDLAALGFRPNQGFATFDDFKAAFGAAGEGKAWHHVVEQTVNAGRFPAAALHNPRNIIRLPHGEGSIHAQISGFYSSKPDWAGGLTVREWISNKSFKEQFEFGIQVIRQFGGAQFLPVQLR